MSTASLSHTFTVGSVQKTFNVQAFLNVVKRRETIAFRSQLNNSTVNISFAGGTPLSSIKNVAIADRSTSLVANRIHGIGYTIISNTNNFSINNQNFIVTDRFTTEQGSIPQIPLFYKHILSIDNVPRVSIDDFTLVTGTKILEIELLDGLFNPISITAWDIDLNTGVIYNNLYTSFINDLNYEIFYIKYTIKSGGETRIYVDLLDNQTIYLPATFEDLDDSMNIIAGRKVYLETEEDGFQITLPTVGTYAYQPIVDARLKVLLPPPVDNTDPWFVRVTNGNIITSINGTVYKYHIAEFLNQVFTPEPPIKKSTIENSKPLTTSLVKLDHQNIHQDTDLALHIDMVINNINGVAKAAFTTNPSNTGTVASNGLVYKKWTFQNKEGIRSIDRMRGFISVDGIKLKNDFEVITTYYFIEKHYEFTLFNFNPITNSSILNKKISIFIDPDSGGSEKIKTLYYIASDEVGKVIESDWANFDNNTQTMVSDGEELYYENIPSFFQTTTSGETDYISPNTHLFIPEFTVEASGVFLVLADIATDESSSIGEFVLYDTRVRGGGIRDDMLEEGLNLYPEIDWYWDKGHWDGLPYPGNASYFIEVPAEILEGAGGTFQSHQIRDIVMKHTAAGVYSVAKSYGIDVTISGITPSASGITLSWTSNGY